MKLAAIIVAGGRGERVGGEIPKQYKILLGRPVIAWSVLAFAEAGAAEIVIACVPEHAELCRDATSGIAGVRLVDGGVTRTASVRAALAAVVREENCRCPKATRHPAQSRESISPTRR